MIYYTFGQLKRRFNISVFGFAEYQNITKVVLSVTKATVYNYVKKTFKDADLKGRRLECLKV